MIEEQFYPLLLSVWVSFGQQKQVGVSRQISRVRRLNINNGAKMKIPVKGIKMAPPERIVKRMRDGTPMTILRRIR